MEWFSGHSSPEHTEWPFLKLCPRHASPPLWEHETKKPGYKTWPCSNISHQNLSEIEIQLCIKSKYRDWLTIDRCFPWKNDYYQLQALVGVLQVFEHGFHTVSSLSILTKAGLALNGHACVTRNLAQLVCKCSTKNTKPKAIKTFTMAFTGRRDSYSWATISVMSFVQGPNSGHLAVLQYWTHNLLVTSTEH